MRSFHHPQASVEQVQPEDRQQASKGEVVALANLMPTQSFHLLRRSAELLAEESRQQEMDEATKAQEQEVRSISAPQSPLPEITATPLEPES